jgi:hypothetical protein
MIGYVDAAKDPTEVEIARCVQIVFLELIA